MSDVQPSIPIQIQQNNKKINVVFLQIQKQIYFRLLKLNLSHMGTYKSRKYIDNFMLNILNLFQFGIISIQALQLLTFLLSKQSIWTNAIQILFQVIKKLKVNQLSANQGNFYSVVEPKITAQISVDLFDICFFITVGNYFLHDFDSSCKHLQLPNFESDLLIQLLIIEVFYAGHDEISNLEMINQYLLLNKINNKMGNNIAKIQCLGKTRYQNMEQFTKVCNYHNECGQFMLERQTRQQFLILNISLSSNFHNKAQFQQFLTARKQIKSQFIPVLEQTQLIQHSICSSHSIMYVIFRHPIKNIQEEINSRQAMDLNFTEAEIWIIINSCLKALDFLNQNIGYHVSCNPQNIYIRKNGSIMLSDAHKFSQFSCRQKISYKNTNLHQNNDSCKMRNLGIIGSRLMRIQTRKNAQRYSKRINQFIQALTNQQFRSYKQAIQLLTSSLQYKKKLEKSPIFSKNNKQNKCLDYRAIQGLQKVESVNFVIDQQIKFQIRSNLTTASNSFSLTTRNNSAENLNEITRKSSISKSNPLLEEIHTNSWLEGSFKDKQEYRSFKLNQFSSQNNNESSNYHESFQQNLSCNKSSKTILIQQGIQQSQIINKYQTNNIGLTRRDSLNISNASKRLKDRNRNSFIKRKQNTKELKYQAKQQQRMIEDGKIYKNIHHFNNTMPINRLNSVIDQTTQAVFSKTGLLIVNQSQNNNFDSISSITESNKATSSSGSSRAFDMILSWQQRDQFEEDKKELKKIKAKRKYQMPLTLSDKNKIALQFLKNREKDVIFEVTESDIEQSDLGSIVMSSRLHQSAKIQKMSMIETPKTDKSGISG